MQIEEVQGLSSEYMQLIQHLSGHRFVSLATEGSQAVAFPRSDILNFLNWKLSHL